MNIVVIMKKILFIFIFLLPFAARAGESFELSASVGRAIPISKYNFKWKPQFDDAIDSKEKIKNQSTYELGIGANLTDNIITQFEYMNSTSVKFNRKAFLKPFSFFSDLSLTNFKAKLSSDAYFMNIKYKYKDQRLPFALYSLIGLGAANNKLSILESNIYNDSGALIKQTKVLGKATRALAFQIGAGVLIPVDKGFYLNFAYKYKDLGKFSTEKTDTDPSYKPIEGRLRTNNFLGGISYVF